MEVRPEAGESIEETGGDVRDGPEGFSFQSRYGTDPKKVRKESHDAGLKAGEKPFESGNGARGARRNLWLVGATHEESR
jgi:hypothetical protein